MTEPKRNKRVKPDPELVKLADALLANYQKPEGNLANRTIPHFRGKFV